MPQEAGGFRSIPRGANLLRKPAEASGPVQKDGHTMNRKSKNARLVHIGFELGLLIKGIDGLLEILGGVLLLYLNPARMSTAVRILTRHELSEDPRDLVANAMLRFSHSFSISAQSFGIFYLISHGVVKCALVFLLWKKKLWAYPLTILFLLLFIAYQIYRATIRPSAFLWLLTAFDAVMIVLTLMEYRNRKERPRA